MGPTASAEWNIGGSSRVLYAGNAAHIFDELPFEFRLIFGLDIRHGIPDEANGDAAFTHAGVESHEIAIAANEEQCAHEQHHGNRDLRDHHQTLKRKALTAAGDSSLAGLQGGNRTGTCATHGWKGSEDNTGEHCHGG